MLLPKTCPVCKQDALVYEADSAVCEHCHVYRVPLRAHQKVIVWARGRAWWWRLPLLAWFGYFFVQNLQSTEYGVNRTNPISLFDFGMHELGHVLFIPFGEFMTILGGSLFQCLFPLLWMGVAIWKKWYFGACLCLCWFGINVYDVAVYAADAYARLLPLSTFSSDYDAAHDWYQILTRLNALDSVETVAAGLRTVAGGAMTVGILAAAALLGLMIYSRRPANKHE
jgi:hypothetical protein